MSKDNLSDKVNDHGVLILSKRDAIEFNYLLEIKGSASIKYAVKSIKGNRFAYVSNLAKILKVDIPKDLPDPSQVIPIEQGLAMLKSVMRMRPPKS
ncbi:MAG: hypothetical protein ACTJGV_02005 [Proteus vulgaris]